MTDINKIQEELKVWSHENFGHQASWEPLLGAMEELGELAHAHLKLYQGIRGDWDKHNAAKKDAIADCIIYLMNYCNIEGFKIDAILAETWENVKQRNWKISPENGNPGNKLE
jgi:NTP pyrophosphatase (non-canonical NTP hydrolase)